MLLFRIVPGRLLTTPTRLLKLILPLPFNVVDKADNTQQPPPRDATDAESAEDVEDIQPLALLVHPQQPLSYLERLLQAELPPIRDGNREKIDALYEYYAQLYSDIREILWSGMASLIGTCF